MKIKFAKITNNTEQYDRIIIFAKINSVKMIIGWICESLLPRKFPAIRYTVLWSDCLCKQNDCMLIVVVYYCLPLVSGHEYKCPFIN